MDSLKTLTAPALFVIKKPIDFYTLKKARYFRTLDKNDTLFLLAIKRYSGSDSCYLICLWKNFICVRHFGVELFDKHIQVVT